MSKPDKSREFKAMARIAIPQEMPRFPQFLHRHQRMPVTGLTMAKTVKPKVQKRTHDRPKRILVPTDFSAASHRALSKAVALGGDGSCIVLLHVIVPATRKDGDLASELASARDKLAQFCQSDGLAATELISFEVRPGAPFREILDCAKENHVEMIVLGVHDSAAFGRLALGHTVDRVSRYATCPVLLVRESDVDLSPKEREWLRAKAHVA
jgi:nucleotide-binding universal stress UspA family protein